MSLLHKNGRAEFSNPCRFMSGHTVAGAVGCTAAYGARGPGSLIGRFTSTTIDKRSAIPAGHRDGGAWALPLIAGELVCNTIDGVGTVAPLNLAGGLNAEAALAGAGTLTAAAQLILSAVAALSGLGTMSAAAKGKLEAAASLAGSGALTSALAALAGAVAALGGVGSLTGTPRGTGSMSATITPFTDLSPQSLAASVWNALVVDFQDAGTMGLLLGEAGGGSSPSTIADAVWDEATSGHTAAESFGSLVQQDVYTAKVLLLDDENGTADRYVVSWFKNGSVVTTGITAPTLHVVKVADGSDLIPSAAMTQIGSLSRFRYNAAGAERIVAGAAYLAVVGATIGGAARSWDQPVGRDSA